MAGADKRSRLVDAAAELVARQGFQATTLAHVADAADVPLGNVYYYFKTKDAIGDAVVETQAAHHRAMRARWDATLTPAERLVTYVKTTIGSAAEVAEHGCPTGTLCAELHKSPGPLAEHATGLLTAWLQWLEAQFRALGKGREAPDLALHVLASVQGASVLAHAFHSPAHMKKEGARLLAWIEEQTAARRRASR